MKIRKSKYSLLQSFTDNIHIKNISIFANELVKILIFY